MIWRSIIIPAAFLAAPVGAQNVPEPKPTARDLYVGCSLFTQNKDVTLNGQGHFENFSGAMCASYGVLAIANREGRVEGKDNRYRFCLPKTAEVSQNPARAMAYAYMDFFEKTAVKLADQAGTDVFVAALIMKWPCNAQN